MKNTILQLNDNLQTTSNIIGGRVPLFFATDISVPKIIKDLLDAKSLGHFSVLSLLDLFVAI